MKILVKLFATFRDNRFVKQEMEFPDDTTVKEVLAVLAIPDEEVAILMVNGRNEEVDHPLKDGDTLSLFPPVGGG
ncbi:MoaD/ThiS family protein [Heliorestis acidaminivorans]|uniref:MoaD/ThiS family protein n=1 Tax=Heliorestis acidaminivorans TaxID=553427 RepID=A0A6I0EN48_9FIRM|nr:MoaD/ThiS family protein [Heliorestis acidaminivorans]KAB2950987.1 MoaD/ThiS family protein [Heliorestis acidaminivorans]